MAENQHRFKVKKLHENNSPKSAPVTTSLCFIWEEVVQQTPHPSYMFQYVYGKCLLPKYCPKYNSSLQISLSTLFQYSAKHQNLKYNSASALSQSYFFSLKYFEIKSLYFTIALTLYIFNCLSVNGFL